MENVKLRKTVDIAPREKWTRNLPWEAAGADNAEPIANGRELSDEVR